MADNKQLIKFQGGCNTAAEPANIPSFGYSMVQNLRSRHPGFEKRLGKRKKHSTADGTNMVNSLFQFSKGKKSERRFYAQMSDGDVLEATDAPPTVTTGAFGSEVYSGTASYQPAAWTVCNDVCIFSNSQNQHQLIFGTTNVKKFVVYKGTAAPPNIPTDGEDYTIEVTDGSSTTVAVLDSLGDLATDYDCIFVCTHVPADTLNWTIPAANGTASVMACKYWKGSWAAVSDFVDGTSASSKTLAQSGAMTWTTPTDSYPNYMYGTNGYWYQLYLSSGDLDSETEVSAVTYDADWASLENVWDGAQVDAVEVQFYDQSATTYITYGSTTVDVSLMTSSDAIYFSSADPIVGWYIDVGDTPNTTASTAINKGYYWNGAAWAEVSGLSDGTSGMSSSGWVTFTKPSGVQKLQFNKTLYYAYWYKFTVDKTLSDDLSIGIGTMPAFSISDFGVKGICNATWKDRAVYVFDKYPNYVNISAAGDPQCLNGEDFGIMKVGDGRANKVIAMIPYYNELLCFQEEKGGNGACITALDGYSPATWGKLIVTSQYSAMNAKCVVSVETVIPDKTSTTLVYFLSSYGLFSTDAKSVKCVSHEIANYFDPTQTECIRWNYETHHWLSYDPTENVIRMGLVSGSSATVCNIFPVLDLEDMTWSFDSHTPALSCMARVEAASGNVMNLVYSGGTADGTVYQENYSANDVSTAIDSYATMEIDGGGFVLNLRDLIMRTKAQSAGSVTLTPYLNGIAGSAKTLAMTADVTNRTHRRVRDDINITNDHISLKFQNATVDQYMYLLDVVLNISTNEGW